EAVERNHGKHQTVYVFPRNLDYTTLIFYGGERFQLLAWDTDVLLEKLKRTDDYVIVGEKESKTVTAYSSLSFTPLLRTEGTVPDRDNPLLLVRGAKSYGDDCMKIALAHRRLDRRGGTELDFYRTAIGLRDRGHEVHLFCSEIAIHPPSGTHM